MFSARPPCTCDGLLPHRLLHVGSVLWWWRSVPSFEWKPYTTCTSDLSPRVDRLRNPLAPKGNMESFRTGEGANDRPGREGTERGVSSLSWDERRSITGWKRRRTDERFVSLPFRNGCDSEPKERSRSIPSKRTRIYDTKHSPSVLARLWDPTKPCRRFGSHRSPSRWQSVDNGDGLKKAVVDRDTRTILETRTGTKRSTVVIRSHPTSNHANQTNGTDMENSSDICSPGSLPIKQ